MANRWAEGAKILPYHDCPHSLCHDVVIKREVALIPSDLLLVSLENKLHNFSSHPCRPVSKVLVFKKS